MTLISNLKDTDGGLARRHAGADIPAPEVPEDTTYGKHGIDIRTPSGMLLCEKHLEIQVVSYLY